MLWLNGYNITLNHFPNGELNLLLIEEAVKLRKQYKKNHFVLKYESDSDLMALYFAKKHLDIRTSDVSTLSISYMPYSRMDRAESLQTPLMLKFMCDFINNLGFDKVYVHEPHSSATGELLNNVVEIYCNVDLLQEVKRKENFNEEVDYLVFPDNGAKKRYEEKIISKNMLYGDKQRNFMTGKVEGIELFGDTENIIVDKSKAIIVDDLSSYGESFISTAKRLYELGFKSVVLLVCHAENSIFKDDLFSYVGKVYTTDTILTEHKNWKNQQHKENLHVFGLIEQMKEGTLI